MSVQSGAKRTRDVQSFEQATSWRRVGDDRFRGEVDPVWGQGRAVYGGIVGASMARAMNALVSEDKQLRSFSVTFAGPVEAGPVECSTELVREGRTATFVSSEITQGGTKRAIANATFGLARDSSLRLSGPPRPELPSIESAKVMPYIDGVMPSFTQRLEFRYAHGGFPFAASDASRIQGWVRFRDDSDPAVAPALLALIDAWPAPGGILRYGIPTFKMSHGLVDRQMARLEAMDVTFVPGTNRTTSVRSFSDRTTWLSARFVPVMVARAIPSPVTTPVATPRALVA